LNAGCRAEFSFVDGWTTAIVVLHGNATINGQSVGDTQFAQLEREGEDVTLEADSDTTVLILSGEPIDEPIAGWGPFVMNTQTEIQQAISDFNSGKFGRMQS